MEQAIEQNDPPPGAVKEKPPLSEDELAAYIDGRLTGEELVRVEARIADDPAARREFSEAASISVSAPAVIKNRRRRWEVAAVGVIAAAAVITIAILPGNRQASRDEQVSTDRPAADVTSQPLIVVSPLDLDTVSGEEVQFRWRPIEGASYRIALIDEEGQTLLQLRTTDTIVVPPDSVRQKMQGRVFWTVDALAADGSSATSGIRELVIRPQR